MAVATPTRQRPGAHSRPIRAARRGRDGRYAILESLGDHEDVARHMTGARLVTVEKS
jgi:hypothetical protein